MKNHEAMPTPAQEPEHLEVEDEDIDKLMRSFEDKQRSHALGEQIAETAEELAKEKHQELRSAGGDMGLVKTEAAAAAKDVVAKDLEEASKLLDSDPSVAVMTLLKPVTERLQTKLDPAGGFDMPHGDPRVQAMYDRMAQDLKRDAIAAVAASLEERWESLADGDPEKARVGRLIGLVEGQAQEKAEPKEEEIKPLADELEPEPAALADELEPEAKAAPKKKSFFQRLLGK